MRETVGKVVDNRELAPGFRLLTLDFEHDVNPEPGQFGMFRQRGSFEPLLRRALAVYRIESSRRMSFLYAVMGRGTQALSQARAGDGIEALLPLGNDWLSCAGEVAPELPQQRLDNAVVVAGGIGSASVLMLAEELIRRSVNVRVFFGAANEQAAIGCGLEDFRALDVPLVVTTDDGSTGLRGFVTEPLEAALGRREGEGGIVFACGPWAMMKRTAEVAFEHRIPCLVSLEAPMGCGFGVCVGCVVAVKHDGPEGYDSYVRVCTDGSIMRADRVRWDINAMAH